MVIYAPSCLGKTFCCKKGLSRDFEVRRISRSLFGKEFNELNGPEKVEMTSIFMSFKGTHIATITDIEFFYCLKGIEELVCVLPSFSYNEFIARLTKRYGLEYKDATEYLDESEWNKHIAYSADVARECGARIYRSQYLEEFFMNNLDFSDAGKGKFILFGPPGIGKSSLCRCFLNAFDLEDVDQKQRMDFLENSSYRLYGAADLNPKNVRNPQNYTWLVLIMDQKDYEQRRKERDLLNPKKGNQRAMKVSDFLIKDPIPHIEVDASDLGKEIEEIKRITNCETL